TLNKYAFTPIVHKYDAVLRQTSTRVALLLFFFFSSRRRHTRWPRDWSSDVCSSDLYLPGFTGGIGKIVCGNAKDFGRNFTRIRRSEERRVGKECRSRWWAYE